MAAPAVVQVKTGGGTGASTLTVTLASPTTAGNLLAVIVQIYSSVTIAGLGVSSVQLGGVADNFSQAFPETVTASQFVNAVWLDRNCAGGQTAVKVTLPGSNSSTMINVFAYEISGSAYSLDIAASMATGSGSSFSMTGPVSTSADVLWIGGYTGRASSSFTVTGPTSPWTANGAGTQTSSFSTNNFADLACFTNPVTGGAGSVTFSGSTSGSTSAGATILVAIPGLVPSGAVNCTVSDPAAGASGQAGAWGCPSGITAISAAAWGGGGGGHGTSTSTTGGRGGGGGEYAAESSLAVTPGSVYPWTTGAGGAGGAGAVNGTNGGSSTMAGDSVTVTANSGGGGLAGTPGAGGTGSTNTTHHDGGSGGVNSSGGGGGGGSGGTGAAGNPGTSPGGATAVTGGGPGGSGQASGSNGNGSAPASGPGGGGGGSYSQTATVESGGNGWSGQLTLSYTIPATGTAPFTRPTSAATRHPAARSGYSRGSSGAPVTTVTAPLTPARKPAKGAQAARRGHSRGSAGAPVTAVTVTGTTPAPFTAPGKPSKGRQAAQPGRRAQGAAGAPAVPYPTPFTRPRRAIAGRRARTGTSQGSMGAPYVFVPPTVTPATQAHRAVKGAQAARRGHGHGNAGTPLTVILPTPLPVFPAAPLDARVELNLGGTWTDISDFVFQAQDGTAVTIGRGRPDQSSSASPGTAAMKITNRDGRFTAANPTGPWYGLIGRNTPIRVSVPAAGPYLRLEDDSASCAACPDSVALSITGDLDLRLDLALTSYTAGSVLAAKQNGASQSWALTLNGDGTLTWAWTDSGSAAHTAVSTVALPTGRITLRVTLHTANSTVTFWTAPPGNAAGSVWTQLGQPVSTGAATSVLDTTAAVSIGNTDPAAPSAMGANGRFYQAQLRNGLGGLVVADAQFSAQTPGVQSFTGPAGNTWTLYGTAEISARNYRFHGEMSSSPKATDPTETDVYVPLACGGLLRRLQQGNAPVYSTLRRAIQSLPGQYAPIAYWPCEDLADSSFLGSAVGGIPGVIIGPAQLATNSDFPGSLALPALNGSTWLCLTGAINNAVAGGVTWSSPGTYTWTCPPGVTQVIAACWGGGGGGSASLAVNNVGGGGGGGEYASGPVAVTPGHTYTVVVGRGGSMAASGTVTAAALSSFAGDAVTITANPGQTVAGSGSPSSTGGAGGTGSSAAVHHNGGAGGTGNISGSTGEGGGGGGSGGAGTAGNAGGAGSTSDTSTVNGATAVPGGAPGGQGGSSGNAGSAPPTGPGGGGGGAASGSSGVHPGGRGADGQTQITWATVSAGAAANITRFCLEIPAGGGIDGAVLLSVYTSGTVGRLDLAYGTGGKLSLTGYNPGGGALFGSGAQAFGADGQPMLVSLELVQAGGNVTVTLTAIAPGAAAPIATWTTSLAGVVGLVIDAVSNPNSTVTDTTCIGHIFAQYALSPLTDLAAPLAAWVGEAAASRFGRLCGENGIAARILGYPAVSAAMGPQSPDTLPNLLQACEDADRGMMFEPAQAYALGYRTLASLLNQAAAVTLDWAQGQLDASAFTEPTDDDLYTANDVTASRSGGNSQGTTYRAILDDGTLMSISPPPTGAGDYATSASVNVELDAQIPDIAGWLVHTGTVAETRYPAIPVDLSWAAMATLFYALQDVTLGDYVRVLNQPVWIAPDDIRQLAAGTAETIGVFMWKLAWNAIPERPFETGVFDDPVYGRLDTDGSTLAAPAGPTDTTLSVATTQTGSPLWTTSPGDFPFDIGVGGERITVTAVTGTSSPQTFTVIRSVNGVVKNQASGTPVTLFFPPILAIA